MQGFDVERLEHEHVEYHDKQVCLLPLPVVSDIGNLLVDPGNIQACAVPGFGALPLPAQDSLSLSQMSQLRLERQRSGDLLLPQDLESQEGEGGEDRDPKPFATAILTACWGCDIGLFLYDGRKLDSGTVVEFMFSKFADIPSVIVRTDFRNAGDSSLGDPWNLMSSFFPRTEILLIHSMSVYQGFLKAGKTPWEASSLLAQHIARSLLLKMEEALRTPPVLPGDSSRDRVRLA
jgi:hypothetical protein